MDRGIWAASYVLAGDQVWTDSVGAVGEVPLPAGLTAQTTLTGSDWPVLTIAKPANPLPGHAFVVRGTARLSASHKPALVRLYVGGDTCQGRTEVGGFLGATRVHGDGTWAITSYRGSQSDVCVSYGIDDAGQPIDEAVADGVHVTPAVIAAPVRTMVRARTNARILGRVFPSPGATTVGLQRRAGMAWRTVGHARVTNSGSFVLLATPSTKGAFSYRVFAGAHTVSKPFTIVGT